MLLLGVMFLFVILCELAVIINLTWSLVPHVKELVDKSNTVVDEAVPVISFMRSAVDGMKYNMTTVIQDSLPASHEGMVSLMRGVWSGTESIFSIITAADQVGMVEVLYPLLIGLGWLVADNRTGPVLSSTGDVINWVAERAVSGDIDTAAGFTKNTTMLLLDYTMSDEAHESLRFGLDIANKSIPLLEAAQPVAEVVGRMAAHDSLPIVADRVARGIEFTTEGRGMYEWVQFIESIRDNSKHLAAQAVESNVIGSLSNVPDAVRNVTDAVRAVTQSEVRLSVGSALGFGQATQTNSQAPAATRALPDSIHIVPAA
ncbi:MAG: hypothetical protein AB7P49_03175 [Bdellovibrionales bacterium]